MSLHVWLFCFIFEYSVPKFSWNVFSHVEEEENHHKLLGGNCCYLLAAARRSLLEIDTWFCTEGRNAVRRDWTVKEVRTGEIIARATRYASVGSAWFLVRVQFLKFYRERERERESSSVSIRSRSSYEIVWELKPAAAEFHDLNTFDIAGNVAMSVQNNSFLESSSVQQFPLRQQSRSARLLVSAVLCSMCKDAGNLDLMLSLTMQQKIYYCFVGPALGYWCTWIQRPCIESLTKSELN
jgi:hypothetical protein